MMSECISQKMAHSVHDLSAHEFCLAEMVPLVGFFLLVLDFDDFLPSLRVSSLIDKSLSMSSSS